MLGKNSSAKDDSTHVPYGASPGIAATVKENESVENILLSNKQRKSVQLSTVLEKGSNQNSVENSMRSEYRDPLSKALSRAEKGSNQNSKENSVRSEYRDPLSKVVSKAEKIEESIAESQVSAKVAAALESLVTNPDVAAGQQQQRQQQQHLILTSPPVQGAGKCYCRPSARYRCRQSFPLLATKRAGCCSTS